MIAAIAVFLLSFFVKLRLPIPRQSTKILAWLFVIAGMSLVGWAAAHIKGAFLAEVEPRLDMLVKSGPYKFVRHPVYLGMTIAMLGIPIAFRSMVGLLAVFILFLPSEVYRAKLEEQALARTFGEEWENYARKTSFLVPITRRK